MASVVVIGAGMGGLSAAARLATAGHRVTVCEQAPALGGKLGRYTRDGFTFDTGPHLLTLPSVYEDLFAATGAPLRECVPVVPLDPVCHYRFADGLELDLPSAADPAPDAAGPPTAGTGPMRTGPMGTGPARIAAAWDEALGEGAGADWTAFLERAGRIWEATRGPFLESPLQGARTLVAQSRRLHDLRTIAPWSSLRDLGRRYLRDPHQRTVLDRYATYTGSDPRRAPAALATVPYVEQTFGAWYVPGGLHRLGEAVAGRARDRGADLRTDADVARITVSAGRATGVRLRSGERLPADVVVADADARHVYRDLLDDVPRRHRRIGARRPSLSGVVLLLALRGRTPGLRHHTVLFPADYDDEFDSIFATPRPVPDPTIYISAPDDPALRPDEAHEAWFVLVNAPRHDPATMDWTAPGLADRYADHLLDVMASRGLDVRGRLLWREVRTPADLERDTRSVGGSIYGTSSNGPRAAFLRPANRSPVPGLFLVGGSAHPGGGLPLVGLSAAIVARLIGPA